MAEDAPQPDEEDEAPEFPDFDRNEFSEMVGLRLVPKDNPNSALIRQLAMAFADAARQAGRIPAPEPLVPVPDDQGIHLRAILDQKKEEIRAKAAQAEPRAAEFRKRVEEHGPEANAAEVAAARERILQTVLELHRLGVVMAARAE